MKITLNLIDKKCRLISHDATRVHLNAFQILNSFFPRLTSAWYLFHRVDVFAHLAMLFSASSCLSEPATHPRSLRLPLQPVNVRICHQRGLLHFGSDASEAKVRALVVL